VAERGMPKVTLEVSEEVAQLLRAMEKRLRSEARVAHAFGEVDPDGALGAIDEAAKALTLDAKRRLLREYDVDAHQVRLGGKVHTQVGRYTATYKTKQGPVEVERSLYREVGVRNGPTTDVISARTGCVADGWLPEAATAMAYLLGRGTSREAEEAARKMGVLPYSRPSFERVGHEVGELYGRGRERVEAALAKSMAAPEGCVSVSLSMDRVSLPMEEPKPRPVGRPRRGAAKRPVDVHDGKGDALGSIRYGRMPRSGPEGLAARLALDVEAVLEKQPGLAVVVLTDGAPELHALLDEALARHAPLAKSVTRLVDFWHLIQKLSPAAQLIAADAAGAIGLQERWKMALLNTPGAVWKIASELIDSGKRGTTVGEHRPVHEAITYTENHGERMAYAEARASGLSIGSGNVEATCKSLVAMRMKRPGSRWKEESGQHVLDLRSLVLSQRWDGAMDQALAPLRLRVRPAA